MSKLTTYPERESKSLEFKSILPKLQSLVKTCVAFANGAGGSIVIGVEDKTRKIIGVTEEVRDKIYDDFSNCLYDSTSPNLFAQIYEKNFDGASVMIIKVPPSIKKPYFLKKEGMPKGVYLRVGSSTRRANQEHVEDLIREGQRITFDEESINTDISILSKSLLKHFYKTQANTKRLLSDRLITQATANKEKYFPTVAGVILFGNNPEQFVPESSILCTQFSGKSGRDIIQTKEITGNLEKQAENCFELINSWLPKKHQLQGIKLKETSPIPKEALRETIINALIHRKYSIPGAVKVALYDDRLEIFSPGCFPGLVNIANLGDGTTYLRNPIIARVAHKIGLVEKLGSGIRLVFDSCEKAGLAKPKYSEDGDFVKITFNFSTGKIDDNAILELIKSKDEITIAEITRQLSISRNTATRKINNLIDANKIIRIGKGPATRFRIL
ncbi:MAG: putative DNA binding domain-containing protein [Gammaproteobacteria bacterium]|nr:putative DNA binding domain-containing protein [Gammaproteobacteria bacterium]